MDDSDGKPARTARPKKVNERSIRTSLFLKIAERIGGNTLIFNYLVHRLPPGLEFELKEHSVESTTNNTLVTIECPSRHVAARIKRELTKGNRVSGTKIHCFDSRAEALNIPLRTEDAISTSLKKNFDSIIKRAESVLSSHDEKLSVAIANLTVITGKRNKRLSIDEFQRINEEEIATKDKITEMERQRTEFQLCLSMVRKNLLEARQAKNFDKHVNDARVMFGIECLRLKSALPMYARRSDIIDVVRNNQVSIIIGETGSGKSTQMTQYIYQNGLAGTGKIACTQPRKVAAVSLATHVSKEMATQVGQLIGYKVGMQVKMTDVTRILYMTDHVLLNECLRDRKLSTFSCIIIDEAHERSIYTDLLLGMIKDCLKDRPDLRVIITSATIDPSVFVKYFNQCPVLEVSGRMYPVEIVWQEDESEVDSFGNYQAKAVEKAIEVHKNEPEGDILVFLTSPLETEKCCELMKAKLEGEQNDYVCLQIHGRLQTNEQQLVFEPTQLGKRKIVFATNSAETSVTIPGIKYVIDTGVVKEMQVDVKRKINTLSVTKITQSSANQRKGRAGRTGPGKCYRLYSESDYNQMIQNNVPEILRVNLSQAVLKLTELDINPLKFDFVMSPSRESMEEAVRTLIDIGAVSSDIRISDLGRWIAKLPLDPKYGALIHDAVKVGLSLEGIVLGSACGSGSLFYRSGTDEEKEELDRRKIPLCDEGGDILTSLHVFKEWNTQPEKLKGKWCVENSINGKAIKGLRQTINEVISIMRKEKDMNVQFVFSEDASAIDVMRQLLFKAFKGNVCCYLGHPKAGYHYITKRQTVNIHPSSALKSLGCQPEWFVFDQVMRTSRDFAMSITPISEEQLAKANSAGVLDIDINDAKRRKISEIYHQTMGSQLFREMVGQRYIKLKTLEGSILSIVGDSTVFVLDADREKGSFRGFSSLENKLVLENVIDTAYQEILNKFKKEESEHKIGTNMRINCVRAVIGEGGETLTMYMPDEFKIIKVHYTSQDREDIKDEHSVQTEFQKFGKIVEIKQYRPNPKFPSLWGQLTFERTESAKEAVCQLNRTKDGFSARPNVPLPNMAQQGFKAKIRWCRRPSRGFGFVKFNEVEDSIRANHLGNINIAGAMARIKVAKNDATSVHVSGFSKLVNEDVLCQAFTDALHISRTDIAKPTIVRERVVGNRDSLETYKRRLQVEIEKFTSKGSYSLELREPKETDINFLAFVTFDKPEEGNEACTQINTSFSVGVEKVSMVPDLHCSVFIHKKIYETSTVEIDNLITQIERQDGRVKITCKRLKNDNVVVTFHTDSTNALATAKHAIQDIIRGDVIERENNDIFRQLFTWAGNSKLQSIMSRTKTLIITDNRVMTMSVHGLKKDREAANRLINEHLVELANEKSKFISLVGDGKPVGTLKALIKQFGIDMGGLKEKTNLAALKIDVRYHRIHISGTAKNIERAEQMIKEVLEKSTSEKIDTEDELDCVTCFCPVDSSDAYQVECCGHLYCKECIQSQLQSAIESKDFPIICGAENCGTSFVWKDISSLSRRGLVTEAALVTSSVGSFVTKNKNLYHYCITPDCPVVYRITENGQRFVCPECDIILCTKCHIQFHEGLTCAMYNSLKTDDGGLNLWMHGDTSNRKLCPSCTTPIEKIDGCQHMTCIACKKHICWICMQVFSDGGSCYGHLQSAHNTFV